MIEGIKLFEIFLIKRLGNEKNEILELKKLVIFFIGSIITIGRIAKFLGYEDRERIPFNSLLQLAISKPPSKAYIRIR